jgi:hypothetical protein
VENVVQVMDPNMVAYEAENRHTSSLAGDDTVYGADCHRRDDEPLDLERLILLS